ncbi:hypothetical protein B0H17DRAFT_1126905 [Mycena rosella]|uniref:Uncharacterized protein n=1 Tax=Mycena rosella TaxID=1033263 RepID=A0AAD7M7I2_MYCRO|nr:hypothetical protein B0H17DRAFT_1126905 [Mycena rosella]
MSSLATFCNVPVCAMFDGNAATSSVSLDWIMRARLRTRNSQASGLLALPCDVGVISMCMNVSVAATLPSDLVLGLDWFQFVCETGSEIVVHLSPGPLDLQPPPPIIGAVSEASLSIGSSSVTPVFRGGVGVDPLFSSLVSQGGPDVVSTPSSTPCMQGSIDSYTADCAPTQRRLPVNGECEFRHNYVSFQRASVRALFFPMER